MASVDYSEGEEKELPPPYTLFVVDEASGVDETVWTVVGRFNYPFYEPPKVNEEPFLWNPKSE